MLRLPLRRRKKEHSMLIFEDLGALDPGRKVGELSETRPQISCAPPTEARRSSKQELPLFVLESILPLQRLHLNVFEPRRCPDLADV